MIYFKNLAHAIVGTGKFEFLETQAGVNAAVLRQNLFLSKKLVFALRPSTDGVRPTNNIEGNLFHLRFTDCKC